MFLVNTDRLLGAAIIDCTISDMPFVQVLPVAFNPSFLVGLVAVKEKTSITNYVCANKTLMDSVVTVSQHCCVNLLLSKGNINASLMTLRTCMEILRENQGNSENGISPKVS